MYSTYHQSPMSTIVQASISKCTIIYYIPGKHKVQACHRTTTLIVDFVSSNPLISTIVAWISTAKEKLLPLIFIQNEVTFSTV